MRARPHPLQLQVNSRHLVGCPFLAFKNKCNGRRRVFRQEGTEKRGQVSTRKNGVDVSSSDEGAKYVKPKTKTTASVAAAAWQQQ